MSSPLQLGFMNGSRIRLIRQDQMAECGLACLAMVANFHGFDFDLLAMRQQFEPSSRGQTLNALIDCADRIGFSTRAVSLSLDELPQLQMPAILHWDMHHYVVLESIRRGRSVVHDPSGITAVYSLSELSQHFTGVALELRPSADLRPLNTRHALRLHQLWQRMTGLKRGMAQILVLSATLQAFSLATPYYMQVIVDQVLPSHDAGLLGVVSIGFGLFTLFNVAAYLLRSFVLLSVGTSISFGIAANVTRRLFRLPIGWFESRQIGDILSRFQSISPIQQFLAQGSVSALVDGALALATLVLMTVYSATLTAIALVTLALYLAVRLASYRFERDAREIAIAASGREQSAIIESLRGITTLRLGNREAARHAFWQNRFASSTNATVQVSRVSIWQTALSTLLFGIEGIASTWVAASLVIDGRFTVGMVFAYLAYKSQFMNSASSLLGQAIAFRMLRLHLDRLSDIVLTEEDISMGLSSARRATLKGRLECRGVAFRYSPSDPDVLTDVNFTVEPGEHVVLTGPSGGGKSTLAKVLLGLSEPSEGLFLVDGLPLSSFGHRSYRDQLGAVLQNDALFAGSLRQNIAAFDERPSADRVERAAKLAAIHEDILAMPMGYETLVGDMGSSLSGGQRQRVLLARALYREPRLLIIDEGTSHLDAETERLVNDAIDRVGITRVIIAHRKETIERGQRVLTVEGGTVREEHVLPKAALV